MSKQHIKDMMDKRTTLPTHRETVKPVDLYTKPQDSKDTNTQDDKTTSPQVVKYTTHLRLDCIKAVKRYAVENDLKDYEVVQQALDEYFTSRGVK